MEQGATSSIFKDICNVEGNNLQYLLPFSMCIGTFLLVTYLWSLFLSQQIHRNCKKPEDVLPVTSPVQELLWIGGTGHRYLIQNCHSDSVQNPGSNEAFYLLISAQVVLSKPVSLFSL